MVFKLADRVKETTTTAGISNVVLGGAYDGYQTFADAIGNAHKTYYVIVDNSNNNWEVGIGTYHSTGNILSRDVVLESSNSDDKISLTGGVSDVFVSYPAEKVVCLNPDSFVSGVAFSGYAFPDGTTQTSAAVEISDTSNLPNAIAIWSDSSALTKDAGFQFITDKFVNNHPTEMNVLSGIPLTITRYASGNFFEAYIDNTNDRTLALNLTDEASPTWKLGLKNDPSNNLPPEYGYTYGSNGSAGQAATSDTYTTINYSNGIWFTHKSSNLFNFDKTNGGVIYNATASAPAFTVKGAAAQSANLQEWKNISDTVVAYLEPDGSISGNAFRVSGIIFPDGTTQSTTAADGAFSVASGVIQLNLINTNTANITTNTDSIVASGTSIIDSSTALTIASGTAIRSEVASNTLSIGGNTGSITVNRDNIVASGTAIINSYTDLVIASGTAERDLTVASGTSIIGQFSSKANLHSPAFEGTPTAPTAAALTNTTQIATTAFVRTEVTNLVDSAPGTLDTLNELAAALGDDANFSTTVTNSLATKATVNNLAGASGALRHDLALAVSSGVDTSGIAFAAYGWGNHASVGYASPTDFALLYASGADTSGIAWTAYNRGDHRTLGLVTHSTFGSEGLIKRGSSSGVYTAITDNSSNWNTAYSWGDHTPSGTKHARQIDMLAGSGVDTSGIAFDSYAWGDHRTLGLVTHATFGSEGLIKRGSTSGSYSFITDNSSNWNTAYGWGDHSSAGYLTSESDTLQTVTSRGSHTTSSITSDGDISASGNITATSGIIDVLDMTPLGNGQQPAYQEGVVFYDSENHTLTLYNDEPDIALQIGQEQYVRVRNNTGATIQNGAAVLFNGVHGNAAPTVSGAIATSEATSQVIGLASHSIEPNTFGYVTTYGVVRNVDTSAFSTGDEIFLSATQIGSGVNVSPTIPNFKTTIGHVINSASSNGSILVQVGNAKLGGGDVKSEGPLNVSGVAFITSVSDTTAGGSLTDPAFIFDSGNRQLQLGSGLQLLDGVPSNTTNVLYNDGGTLKFNGSAVDTNTTYTAGSGIELHGTQFNVAISGDNILATNTPTNNYVPSYVNGQITWVENAGGGGGGSMSNFIITDGSTPQTIDDGETITFADGTGAEFVTSATNTVTVNSVDSEIVHDNLSGFVANEHINHTSVTLTAGDGLSGGGDISTNRTFTVVGDSGILVTDEVHANLVDYTVQTTAAQSVTTTASRTYAVQVNSSDQLVVNVPWSDTDTTYSEATSLSEGLMSTAHHDKLDGIEAGADVTDATNVTAAGALMDSEVTNLAQVKAFDSSDYATAAQGTKADSAQQPPAEGAFVDGDKTKLDGIEASANNYTLPEATSTTKGGIELFSDTDQAIAANSVTATAARTYGIQLNSAGQAVVNVPWTDTQQSTDVTLVTSSHDYLSISSQAITLGQIDIGDDTNLTAGTNITLSGDTLNVDDAFLVNDADDTTTGTITAGGFTTTGTWTFDEHTTGTVGIVTVQSSSTSFVDNNTSLMTAAAIADKIESYSYSTTVGTVTSVTITGTDGIDVDSGSPITSTGTITLGLSNIPNSSLANSSITVSDSESTPNTTAISLGNTLTFAGTTNETTVIENAGTVTVGLPDNVTIAGNLTVNGTTTTINSTTLSVADPLIILANGNNTTDSVDIGFYGLYDTSGSQDLYAGLFRDANDSGKFKLFKDLQAAPTTTVNTAGAGYAVATLVANIEGDVTGNVSGTAATVTGATQAAITSAANLATVGTITTGVWQATDVAVAHGGTGASTAADARTNLGVAIGSDVQAYDAALAAIAGLATTDGGVIVGNGSTFVLETGATLRTSLGVDAAGTDNSTDVSLNAAVTDVFSISTQEISAVDNGSDAIVGWDDTAGKLTYLPAADVRTVLNVEDGATADQTDAEIRAAVEAATDSNVFTDADHTKLNGIEASANNYTLPSASTTAVGGVELATTAETTAGIDATKAVTPDGLKDGYEGSTNVTTLGTIATGTWNGTAIATDYIADNAITLAKLAGGTDGTIITFDANGDPVAVGPGTDGQVLTSTGAGSPPAFEDASGGATDLDGLTDVTVVGTNNLFIETDGAAPVNAITTGESNIAIGNNSLSTNDSGHYNVGIGDNTLTAQGSGASRSVAIGKDAMQYVKANQCVAIGFEALEGDPVSNSWSQYNTAIGYQTLKDITTGDYNVSLGISAGTDITSASRCIFIGAYAGYTHTTGDSILYIGSNTEANDGTIIKADMAEKHLAIGMADDLFSNSAGDATLQVYPKDAADDAIYVKMPSAHSGNTIQVQDSSGVDIFLVSSDGVVTLSGATKPALNNLTEADAVAIDLKAANVHTLTLDRATTTLSITSGSETAGQTFIIRVTQDGTGSRALNFFGGISWAGGTAPTITTTASKTDVFGFLCIGDDTYDGFVIGQNI